MRISTLQTISGQVDVRGAALLGVLVLVMAGFTMLSDRFLDYDNLVNLLLQASVTGIAAVGLAFVIMTAGIDLSVGSTMNLSLVLAVVVAGTAGTMEFTTETSWLVYPVAVLAGTALGAGNALAIIHLRLNPLIVTLATLSIYRGVALHLTGGREVLVFGAIREFGRGTVGLGIGYPVVAMILLAVLAIYILRKTNIGRFVLAVGGSQRSARENGIPSNQTLIFAYSFAGLAAAVAGLVLVGRVGAVNPDLGWQFEFTVITAVVLGGTSLLGGKGSIQGAIVAAVLLATISNGLNLIGADPYIYDVIRGTILLLAVLLDAAAQNRSALPAARS